MIKVYEHGMYWKRIRCPECNCDFGFSTMSDAINMPLTDIGAVEKSIECPECKNYIHFNTSKLYGIL